MMQDKSESNVNQESADFQDGIKGALEIVQVFAKVSYQYDVFRFAMSALRGNTAQRAGALFACEYLAEMWRLAHHKSEPKSAFMQIKDFCENDLELAGDVCDVLGINIEDYI